jgi:hypothetical protein
VPFLGGSRQNLVIFKQGGEIDTFYELPYFRDFGAKCLILLKYLILGILAKNAYFLIIAGFALLSKLGILLIFEF